MHLPILNTLISKRGTVAALFVAIMCTSFAQTQLGNDIDGKAENNNSGGSISLSSQGNRVAIAAAINSVSGRVRIYEWNGSTWTQLGPDVDGKGTSVALSSEGNRVAIGAAYGTGSGPFRIYEWNGSTWTQLGLDIEGERVRNFWSTPLSPDGSVALSSDGSRVAIGEFRSDGNGTRSGRVRIYEWDGSTWTQLGLDIDGEAAGDESGWSVSLSSDGSRVAIGADRNVHGSGHVRIYEWDGSTWTQLGPDIDGEGRSGGSVSLSSQGNRVAIGAVGNGNWVGHVRIYEWNGSTWTQLGLDIDGEAAGDLSGGSVSLSSDGNRLAIGAYRNDGSSNDYFYNSGHVRVYDWNGSNWTQLGIDIDGEAAGDESGWSVSLSSDGSRVAIGAPRNDGNNGVASGHVRVYDLTGGTNPTIELTLSSNTLDFSSTEINQSSELTFTIENTGTASANISSIGLKTGPSANQFSHSVFTGEIASGTSETITVTFTPTSEGSKSAIIEIISDDPNSPQEVTLTGTGIAPSPSEITLSATSLDFGSTEINQSNQLDLLIDNVGTVPANISSIGLKLGPSANQFSHTDFTGEIAPGASETITVTFTPTSEGNKSAILEIISDDPDSPHEVSLSGSGSTLPPGNTPAFTRLYTSLDENDNPLLEAFLGQPVTITVEGQDLPEGMELNLEGFELTGSSIENLPDEIQYTGVFNGSAGTRHGYFIADQQQHNSFQVTVSSNIPGSVLPLVVGTRLQNNVQNILRIKGEGIIGSGLTLEFYDSYDESVQLTNISSQVTNTIEDEDGYQVVEFAVTPSITIPEDEFDQGVIVKLKCCDGIQIERYVLVIYDLKGSIEKVYPEELLFTIDSDITKKSISIESLGTQQVVLEEIIFEDIDGLEVAGGFTFPHTLDPVDEIQIGIVSTDDTPGEGFVKVRYNTNQTITIPVKRVQGVYANIKDPDYLNIHSYARNHFLNPGAVRSNARFDKLEIHKDDNVLFSHHISATGTSPILITENLVSGHTYTFVVSALDQDKINLMTYTYELIYDGEKEITLLFPLNYYIISKYLISYMSGNLQAYTNQLSTQLLSDMFLGSSLKIGYSKMHSLETLLNSMSRVSTDHSNVTAKLGRMCHELQLLYVYFSEADGYYNKSLQNLSALLKGLIRNYLLAKDSGVEVEVDETLFGVVYNKSTEALENLLVNENLRPILERLLGMFSEDEDLIRNDVSMIIALLNNFSVADAGNADEIAYKGEEFSYELFFEDLINTYLRTIALRSFIAETEEVANSIFQNVDNYDADFPEFAHSWSEVIRWTNREFIHIDWVDIFKKSTETEYLKHQEEIYGYLGKIFTGTSAGHVFTTANKVIGGIRTLVTGIAFAAYQSKFLQLAEKTDKAFANQHFIYQ